MAVCQTPTVQLLWLNQTVGPVSRGSVCSKMVRNAVFFSMRTGIRFLTLVVQVVPSQAVHQAGVYHRKTPTLKADVGQVCASCLLAAVLSSDLRTKNLALHGSNMNPTSCTNMPGRTSTHTPIPTLNFLWFP